MANEVIWSDPILLVPSEEDPYWCIKKQTAAGQVELERDTNYALLRNRIEFWRREIREGRA